MTERDLDRLKDLPVPPPRAEARTRAMAAALEVFDQSAEKSGASPQGMDASNRLMNAPNNPRSTWMRSKRTYAIAASITAAAVILPATLYQLRQGGGAKPAATAATAIAKVTELGARARIADQHAAPAERIEAAAKPATAAAPAADSPRQAVAAATAVDANQSAWVKLCEKATGKKDRTEEKLDICLTHHERLDGNTGMTIVSAAVREIAGRAGRTLMVMVPLGVDMPAGIEVIFDGETETFKLPFTQCHPGGCTAEAELTPALLAKLQQGKSMIVRARNVAGMAIDLPVPLTGFAAAYAGHAQVAEVYGKARASLMQQVEQRQIAMLEKAEADSKTSNSTVVANAEASKVWNAPLGQLRADMAKPADPAKTKPHDPGQSIRFGAATKFDGEADGGQTGTRRVETVPIGRDGNPAGGVPALAAPKAASPAATVPGMVVAAPPPPPVTATPGRVATVLFPKSTPAQAVPGNASTPPPPSPLGTLSLGRLSTANPAPENPAGRPMPSASMPNQSGQQALILPPGHDQPSPRIEESRDRFATAEPAPFKSTASEPVSTFSVDVDTASYAFVRRSIQGGRLPPREAVRIEEMLNYFPYSYPTPESAGTPFQPTITVLPAPWNTENRLVHVALKGYALNAAERPRANLVLLIDVSGSMAPTDRLPLLKSGFRMLVEQLKPTDSVAIVTYANNTRIALEPTKATDKGRILQVIDSLQAGGGTYGEGGLQRAYALAEANFDRSAVNRVILATDGDFNIGIADHTQLKTYIESKRQTGIFLSVLGVGRGNHNDRLMQALAQNGNGVAAYIDTLSEARKVLIEEASSSLFPIAKDVKIQIEFNPAVVAEYRLIGYETRALKREDFNNDKVDAGDVGSGHNVTALYEVVPVGAKSRTVDTLRYKPASAPATTASEAARRDAVGPTYDEYGFFKLRYKLPAEDTSKLIEVAIGRAQEKQTLSAAPIDVRWAIATAMFGQLLQGGAPASGLSWDQAIEIAQSARGDDPFGYRAEMITLMRLAKALPR